MLVLPMVLASTCLTITAQYSECEPSFAGSCPVDSRLGKRMTMDGRAGLSGAGDVAPWMAATSLEASKL